MTLSIPQLHLMRSLAKDGLPPELLDIFLARCGATPAEWEALRVAGWVGPDAAGRLRLTPEGKREYLRQKKGRYF